MLFMPSYLPGGGTVACKLVSVHEGNPQRFGLPVVNALVLLQDAGNGGLLAIMDGTTLTNLRTGAACALAANCLARKDARTVGVFGTGVVAWNGLLALADVRELESVKVYSPSTGSRKRFSGKVGAEVGLDVMDCDKPGEVLKKADIIITGTTSEQPVFGGALLEEGTHISAMGNYQPHVRELDTTTVSISKLVVDSRETCLAEAGDIILPMREGAITEDHIHAELGEILAGQKPGRRNPEEITLFTSVGNALQDPTAATMVYRRAVEQGFGQELEF